MRGEGERREDRPCDPGPTPQAGSAGTAARGRGRGPWWRVEEEEDEMGTAGDAHRDGPTEWTGGVGAVLRCG